mmetsp:Transcript_14034/g.17398  ORF Transcript_14034/g.17398 Transcript_14034/m.17398 type:complete len:137 (-) Transcript_14034:784-1194(-)|eukprot:CAMPEP_0204856964 /NCGR_PEP_ID=MMETSP1347-20130617/19722_1 /ASSEMBLY_ACC=CAM_ASM_000690 /TAXON_ID=215587 /ORGANISM="Aplanochytrium stocchinoi, Strain GSBS06" /LENGTH=136 /DNA_ID=CAMNT_0052004035 /DNA_START=15 /DNA_END=425 /DNA_ORIENTATION=-
MPRITLEGHQLPIKLLTLKGATEPIVVWLTATKKPDGTRWCPDCEASDALVEEVLQTSKASTHIIQVELSREEWRGDKGPDHFLRKEPYGASGIPSIFSWDSVTQKVKGNILGEAECQQIELLTSFLQQQEGLPEQ